MKYLVPVDFTDTAANALTYALSLGKQNDKYTLFHAWDSLVRLSDSTIVMAGANKEIVIKRNLDALLEVVLNLNPKFKNYKIELKSGIGNPVNAITKEAELNEYDAIVMGTRDKHDIYDKMFGTVSLGVIKKTNLPVYLIPNGAKFEKIEKVLVGTDYHLEMDDLINKILEWNRTRRAALHFLHMTQPGQEFENLKTKLFDKLIMKRSLPYILNFQVVVSDNVAQTIISKANTYKHDLILIVPEKQSWMNSLLRGSVSKDLSFSSKKPILFMHSIKNGNSKVKLNPSLKLAL